MKKLLILALLLLLTTPAVLAEAAPPVNMAILVVPLIEHKYAKNIPQVSLAFITQRSKLSGEYVFLPLAGEKTNLTLAIKNNGTCVRVFKIIVKVNETTYNKTIILFPGEKKYEVFPLGSLSHGAKLSVEIIDLVQGLDVLYREFLII